MLVLKKENFVGKGNERACYIHPGDANKAVKITYEGNNRKKSKQTNLEIKSYQELAERGLSDWRSLPRYFGTVNTNKGEGIIVEVVRDYDGKISKTLEYYLDRDGTAAYAKELNEYRDFFLRNKVIFNYGMMPNNILVRKNSENDRDLVLIDGLGDVAYFTFPNKIAYFARRKIKRRWNKFVGKYLS